MCATRKEDETSREIWRKRRRRVLIISTKRSNTSKGQEIVPWFQRDGKMCTPNKNQREQHIFRATFWNNNILVQNGEWENNIPNLWQLSKTLRHYDKPWHIIFQQWQKLYAQLNTNYFLISFRSGYKMFAREKT